jgi:hypothetical protein
MNPEFDLVIRGGDLIEGDIDTASAIGVDL